MGDFTLRDWTKTPARLGPLRWELLVLSFNSVQSSLSSQLSLRFQKVTGWSRFDMASSVLPASTSERFSWRSCPKHKVAFGTSITTVVPFNGAARWLSNTLLLARFLTSLSCCPLRLRKILAVTTNTKIIVFVPFSKKKSHGHDKKVSAIFTF